MASSIVNGLEDAFPPTSLRDPDRLPFTARPHWPLNSHRTSKIFPPICYNNLRLTYPVYPIPPFYPSIVMPSKRKIQSSRANGAKSHGPSTPEGKKRSAQNALHHGLLSQCVLLQCESDETFATLRQQHLDRFQPADGVEYGMISEMVVAKWRLHRTWAMQTRMFELEMARLPADNNPAHDLTLMASAFDILAVSPARAVLDRYESRFDLAYQRALRTLISLRAMPLPDLPDHDDSPSPDQDNSPKDDLPKEPSPISEHTAPVPRDSAAPKAKSSPQPIDSKSLDSCWSLRTPSDRPAANVAPVSPAPPPRPKRSGAAV